MAVMTAYSSRGVYHTRRCGGRRAHKHRAAPLNAPRLGRLTRSTDRKGQVSGFQYDLLDRRTQAGHGATSTVNPVYQNSTAYTWDQANRLTRIVDSVGGTITRTYDDRFDTVKQESGPEGTVDTTYYANGLKQSVDPTGGPVVTHTYDNANRLTGLSQAAGVGQAEPASVQNVGFSYDSADRTSKLTLANGIQILYTWDSASQLTGIAYRRADNTLIGDLTYTYDAAGQRTGMGGSLAATDLPADVPTTAYDADNRLTNWNGQALSYDDNGNLTSDGTTTYTWNSRDQLVALAGATSASFAYDGLGRRKSKTVNGVSTAYLYDGMNPIQEQSGATIQANLLAGPGLDQWVARTQGGQTVSYLPDALGSTLALANASQALTTSYTYEPYGKTTTSGAATGNAFAYTGRENDGTGLYYYRARYYHPGIARFVSEDPIGLAGGYNTYAYVDGDPISSSDPEGLQRRGGGNPRDVFPIPGNRPGGSSYGNYYPSIGPSTREINRSDGRLPSGPPRPAENESYRDFFRDGANMPNPSKNLPEGAWPGVNFPWSPPDLPDSCKAPR